MLEKLIIGRVGDEIYSFAYDAKGLIFVTTEKYSYPTEAIYWSKVTRVNQSNRTAFVEYLPGVDGFVNLSNEITVQAGSYLPLQLVWSGDSTKQAKLRTAWQLVGKYMVFGDSVPSRLKTNQLSTELSAKLVKYAAEFPGTWYLRSCVQFVTDTDLIRQEMCELWNAAQKIINSGKSEICYAGVADYLKILRSLKLANGCEVVCNDLVINQELLAKQELWQIDAVSYDPNLALDGLVADYQRLTNQRDYVLNSGATLEIHCLSGINLIDVNGGNVLLAHHQLNLSVLDAIYQQICVRNLQGIILIDMVKNLKPAEQGKIMEYLRKLFKVDITNTSVLGFSHTGFCELIRNKF